MIDINIIRKIELFAKPVIIRRKGKTVITLHPPKNLLHLTNNQKLKTLTV